MAVLLGRTTAGTAGTDFNGPGHTALWKFTAVASGRLATIFAQTQVANATGTITLGIYTDSAGVANTLLGKATVSGTGTGTGVFSADISSSAIDIVNGTVYWLGWRNSAENMDFKGDTAGSYDENAGTVDFPTPWTAGSAGSVNAIIWGEDAGTTVAGWGPQPRPPMAMVPGAFRRERPTVGWLDSSTQPVTNTDTAEGLITLGGSRSESASIADSAAGMIRLSGSKIEAASIADSGAGKITLGGTSINTLLFTDSPAGQIRLSGARSDGFAYLDAATGTIRFSGSSRESASIADSRAGRITLGGSSQESFISGAGTSYTDSAAGLIRLSGQVVRSAEYVTPTATPGFFIDRRGRWGRQDHGREIFWDGRE
jgi:hypothetical protein